MGTMQLAPVVSYYVAGNSPERIYTADLDGDTKTDISVTHSGGQTLSTFRNIGTAGSIAFANRVDFTFSTNVGAEQAVGDLNGDGKVDIAGATGNGPAILNNLGTPGTISLAAPVWLNSFYDGYYSLADYDGDGKLDIGVLELAFTQITIFRNKFIGSLANAGPDANLCLGDSIQLGVSAVAGNTYSWTSSPAGFTSSIANPFVRPLVTTTYYLTVVNGPTTAKDTVVITVNPVPAANAGADRTICASANTTIGTAASGGNTYSWSSSPAGFTSATANPTVNPVVNTSYYLTVTNGFGCTAKDTVLVTVSTPVANAGPDKQLCPGDATGIGVAATGDTYAWTSNPAGFVSTISNPTVSPAVTTTYFLAVTNALTCVARDKVTVTVGLPVANAGADKTICNGSSTAIGSSGTANNVYSWTSAPAGFTSSSPNPTVNPLVTTSYFLQVTNGSCIARDTVIVNVTPISAPAVSITASNTTVCAGVVVTFTATPVNGGSTPAYQWQVNGVNAGTNSNVFSSGSLTNGSVVKVILTSNASCLSATTATSNSISITVNAVTPAVSVSASATNICPGQNVTFTANPVNGGSNPVYQWKKNGINVGTNSATYNSNTLQNGDQVNVVLSSNAPCAIPATVSGNPVTILVNTNVVAGITASGNTTVVQGASTLISTAITNGGNSPAYQWQDSTAVHSWQNINGATASSVNYTPAASGNKLKCILTGSNPCVVNNTVPSNVLTFIVAPFFTTPLFIQTPL
ncbi:MAG: VCBS repeat-containing protein [Chitinophagaceae bacterium]|nr:VCBS repeat-containing protein [Chitinophagaceae bacterium]